MDGYVDDTTTWYNQFDQALLHGDNPQDLTVGLQRSAQWWEWLLSVTGGALELPKCFYHLMVFNFTKEGKPYLLPPEAIRTPPIRIRDHTTGESNPVTHKPCSEAH